MGPWNRWWTSGAAIVDQSVLCDRSSSLLPRECYEQECMCLYGRC